MENLVRKAKNVWLNWLNDLVNVKTVAPVNSIVDLPLDCLVSIFQNLDVDDLVTLSEAEITEEWKMRTHEQDTEIKIIRFERSIVYAFMIVANVGKHPTFVRVHPDFALSNIKMLRVFGRIIEDLKILYNDVGISRRYEQALEDAVCDNCWETLSSISFVQYTPLCMSELSKPFENVKMIQFNESQIGPTLEKLLKWFPRVRDLRFLNCFFSDASCSRVHFPKIESLKVENRRFVKTMIFTNSHLKTLFSLNPQLKNLDIQHNLASKRATGSQALVINWDLITFVNENLKPETLTLDLRYFLHHPWQEWQSTVSMEGLRTLVMECRDTVVLSRIRIKSHQLTLKFNYVSDLPCDALCYKTLAEFLMCVEPKGLEIIVGCYPKNPIPLALAELKFIERLPQLRELYVECPCDTRRADDVNILLSHCETLEKVRLILYTPSIYKLIFQKHPVSQKLSQNYEVFEKWTITLESELEDNFEKYSIIFQKKATN